MKNRNHKYCPNCKSDNISVSTDGNITYYYKEGKIKYKVFDFPSANVECLDCGWYSMDLQPDKL